MTEEVDESEYVKCDECGESFDEDELIKVDWTLHYCIECYRNLDNL